MSVISMDAVQFMVAKSYTRGLRHAIGLNVVLVLLVAFVAFSAGRTYAYYQQIDSAAKVVEDMKID